jgi:hypothetical protein
MKNKRLIFILGGIVLLIGGAAFLAGRLLNQQVGPAGLGGPLGSNGGAFGVQLIPAEELPKTEPAVTGSFVERKDNTIVVASAPMETGGGGVVVDNQNSEGGDDESLTPKEVPSGPKVEVVVTSETIIYRDTTDFSQAHPGENTSVQETVGEGTLDDLNSDSMIRVWGRRSGDRVIAEILYYSSPAVMMSPGANNQPNE